MGTLKGYNPFKHHLPYKIQNTAADKEILKCFVDIEVKNKSWVPPSHYKTEIEWDKLFPGRGKWLTGPKISCIQEHINHEKKLNHPGPGTYAEGRLNNKFGPDVHKAVSGDKSSRDLENISMAQWMG